MVWILPVAPDEVMPAVEPILKVAPLASVKVPAPLTAVPVPQSNVPFTVMVAPLLTVTVEPPAIANVAPLLTVKLTVLETVPPEV